MNNLINITNEDGKSAVEETKQLAVIEERELLGKQFRIYGDVENPLFLAKEVAEWIEHSNSRMMLQGVDEDEKVVRNVYTLGGNQEQWFLTEDGMYEVLMQSRKPIAKQFKKEVKNILRTIRKHGVYMTEATIEKTLTDPDFIIGLATKLKEEKLARSEAEKKIEVMKPKVLFADAVEASSSSVLVGELAKILKQNGVDIGQNRLFEWLRENGYLIRKRGESRNLPTQKSMDTGLFEIKKRTINNPDGSIRTTSTPKVTGKGQIYFINKFKQSN